MSEGNRDRYIGSGSGDSPAAIRPGDVDLRIGDSPADVKP